MWATIDEGEKASIFVNNEYVGSNISVFYMKTFTTGIGNLRSWTK